MNDADRRRCRRVWQAPSGLRFHVWLNPGVDPTIAQLTFAQADKPWGYIVRSVPGDTDLETLSNDDLQRWFFG